MDWLRSEDLKEEKNVTASNTIIAVRRLCTLALPTGRSEAPGGNTQVAPKVHTFDVVRSTLEKHAVAVAWGPDELGERGRLARLLDRQRWALKAVVGLGDVLIHRAVENCRTTLMRGWRGVRW
jgi:hypothetical protein